MAYTRFLLSCKDVFTVLKGILKNGDDEEEKEDEENRRGRRKGRNM